MKNELRNNGILLDAVKQSFVKLSPSIQIKNPVMLVVYIGAIMTTVLYLLAFAGIKDESQGYTLAIALILWFTVLFANFAEAIAEGRGRAQANSLRSARKDVKARKLKTPSNIDDFSEVLSSTLKAGDIVYVKANEQIPMDGEVIEGAASVDESAITGESAPVIRESGGDRSAVTGGTTLVSDWLVIRITTEAGQSFLDKMIAMVEGAARKKTPNEIALQILLVALTIIFLIVTATLLPYSGFVSKQVGAGSAISITNVIALLVCLAPTTIGALLSSIGIAGMSRLNQANVLAMSGRAIEAAGDVDVLLLDKTGTITLGNRQASEFIPVGGVTEQELADAAQLSSLADETPEGRSVVILAKEKFGIRGRDLSAMKATFVAFTAKTRMSGIDYLGNEIRKGAAEAVKTFVLDKGGKYPEECEKIVKRVANEGGTPLVVAKNDQVMGVIYLKDIVKKGVKERFEDLRKMGIKTIMITGDNPMTAAAISAEAGVDDFLAEATPEAKLALIREYQSKGHLVAMTGDGTNDAPALAQADVAVAMNTGTQAAKEAGNMVDLDSSPTKLIDIVRIGKQLLMTRGALTTFSVANDIAKYFAIIPVLFFNIYPQLIALNFMGLTSTMSAILSAIIYNGLIIIALIPLALKGVKYHEMPAGKLLKRNILIYGLGGFIAPFIAIKLIDVLLTAGGLV
jgi:K+-transporting ATPase ATPase B chain